MFCPGSYDDTSLMGNAMMIRGFPLVSVCSMSLHVYIRKRCNKFAAFGVLIHEAFLFRS